MRNISLFNQTLPVQNLMSQSVELPLIPRHPKQNPDFFLKLLPPKFIKLGQKLF